MFLPVLYQDLNIYFLKYGLLIVHLLEIFIVFNTVRNGFPFASTKEDTRVFHLLSPGRRLISTRLFNY